MIPTDCTTLASQGEVLRRSFEAAFRSDNVHTYALALVAASVPAASARPTLNDVPDERYRFRGERAISGLNTPRLGRMGDSYGRILGSPFQFHGPSQWQCLAA
jgi:hypothetical protein